MVNYQHAPALDATFAALADPTRRAILARLAEAESSVRELAHPFTMSLPAGLKHVEVLARDGLVGARKDGRIRLCRLEAAPLAEASAWIARYRRFWKSRLDALEHYLNETQQKEENTWPPPKPQHRPRSRSRGPSRPPARRSSKPGPKPKR